jgi:hypothetical protein
MVGVQRGSSSLWVGHAIVDTKVVKSVIVRGGIKCVWIIAEVGFKWKRFAQKFFQLNQKWVLGHSLRKLDFEVVHETMLKGLKCESPT